MLNDNNFRGLRKPAVVYKTAVEKGKYGNERLKVSDSGTQINLLLLPVNDKALLEEYGVKYDVCFQTSVFDEEFELRHFYLVKTGKEYYKIIGIKKYPKHRHVILEKIKNGKEFFQN